MRAIVRVALLVGAVAAGAAGMVGPAEATPGQGVTARVVWRWTVEEIDYVLREITIRPGGRTGWHRHPGLVFANVRLGVLTHRWSDCGAPNRYRAGEPDGGSRRPADTPG